MYVCYIWINLSLSLYIYIFIFVLYLYLYLHSTRIEYSYYFRVTFVFACRGGSARQLSLPRGLERAPGDRGRAG